MAIRVRELRRSRGHTSGGSPTARREYMAYYSTDGTAIENAVMNGTDAEPGSAQAPATVNSIPWDSVDAEPTEEDERVWLVRVSYAHAGTPATPAENDEEISFDLGSVTMNVTQSFNTLNEYVPSGKQIIDFKGGIGYDGERFTGIDQMFETFTFSITKIVPKATVEAAAYIQKLRDAAFHTNNAPFRGFAAGEVMFVGASGAKRSATHYAVTFKFMVGKNAANLIVGDIAGVVKGAWNYLWIYYEEAKITVGSESVTVKHPRQANVEQLYTAVNLVQLLDLDA